MKALKITVGGPTVNRLRLSVGNRERPVTFGTDDNAIEVDVTLLYAAGCSELPIDLPRGSITDQTSVWLVTDSVSQGEGLENTDVMIFYAATHPARTAVIVEDLNTMDTADLAPYFPLRDRFMKALQEVQDVRM